MAGLFNDNKAFIDDEGRLTLGMDMDDGAGDATYKYAKGDVFWPVPLADMLIAHGDTAIFTAPGGVAASTVARATGAAGTGVVEISIARNVLGNILMALNPPLMRTFSNKTTTRTGKVSAPKGVKINYVEVAYKVLNTALPAVPTIAMFSRAWPTHGGDAPASSAIAGKFYVAGVETAAASLPVAAHATHVNVVRFVPNTPVFVNDFGKRVFLEFQAQPANTGASDLCNFVGAVANLSVALY